MLLVCMRPGSDVQGAVESVGKYEMRRRKKNKKNERIYINYMQIYFHLLENMKKCWENIEEKTYSLFSLHFQIFFFDNLHSSLDKCGR